MNFTKSAWFESKNKIAVVTNGTAIDGKGQSVKGYFEDISVIYRTAADLDIFGIELNTQNLLEIKNRIASIQQDFEAILIAGIKAPDCYQLLNMVKQELTIPVILDITGIAVATGAALLKISQHKKKLLNEIRFLSLGCNELKQAVLEQLFLLGAEPSLMVSCKKGGFEYAAYASNFTDIMIVFDFQYEHIQLITMELPDDPVVILLNRNLNCYIPELTRMRPDVTVIPFEADQNSGIDVSLACPYLLRSALDQKINRISPDFLVSASVSMAANTQSDPLSTEITDNRYNLMIDQKD